MQSLRRPRPEPVLPVAPVNSSARLRVARWLELFNFSALLAVVVLSAIPYGTVQPQWRELCACAIFLLGALRIVEELLSGRRTHDWQLIWPLLAVALLAGAQTLPLGHNDVPGSSLTFWRTISTDAYETRLFVLNVLAFAGALELLLRYTTTPRRVRALIYVVLAVALASTLYGFLRQSMESEEGAGSLLPQVAAAQGYAQFVNRNHFAFLVEMALGLALGLLVGRGARRGYIFIYLGAAVCLWVGLILVNSRGGILSMLGMMVFTVLLASFVRGSGNSSRERERRPSAGWGRRAGAALVMRVALVVGLLVIIGAGSGWVGGDALQQRMDTISDEMHAPSEQHVNRMQIWGATWALIKAHPFLGSGFGAYWTAIPAYHHDAGTRSLQQAHNDYLEVLASGGLIGGALLVWFIYALGHTARRSLRASNTFRRAVCLGALAGIFAVALHSLFDFGLHVTVNALVLAVLIVLVTGHGQAEHETTPKRRRRRPPLTVVTAG